MVCVTNCLIGCVLLTSMLSCMLTSQTSNVFQNFKNLLTSEQLKLYNNIYLERLSIYIQGMVVGLITAIVVVFYLKTTKLNKICTFVMISLFVNVIYYQLYPKSAYMINYLDKEEQRQAWLEIYKEMKTRKIIGMILGIFGYVFIAKGSI